MAGIALLGLTATELLLSVTLLAQSKPPMGQQQSSSHSPGEAVREGHPRPGALEAEQGGRVPVTNEDPLKVTLARVGSVIHTWVYKFPQLCRENTRPHGCLPYLHAHTALSPSLHASPLCTALSDGDTETSESPTHNHHDFDRHPENEGCFSLPSKVPRTSSKVPREVFCHCSFCILSQTKLSASPPQALSLRTKHLPEASSHHPCWPGEEGHKLDTARVVHAPREIRGRAGRAMGPREAETTVESHFQEQSNAAEEQC